MIARIRVDPKDCRRVYAAVLGDPYGPNDERGVFRSTDGGASWERVAFRSDRAGAVDLALDPRNPSVLYAGFWEVSRKPWLMWSGGEGSGLLKSTDGGATWTDITRNPGLPTALVGKVGVAVSPVDSSRVYAIVEADDGGVFSSDDAGATWTRVSTDRNLRQRAFYYTRIYADTEEKDTLYVLNVQFWRSRDGGKTWSSIAVPHGDNHDLWIDPADNQRMINANDGGANVSVNAGATWTGQLYPTAQMYTLATTAHEPYHICGGQQDNSTVCVPSDGNGSWWYAVAGCESGWVAPHPRDTNIYYGGCYGGSLQVYDRDTGQNRSINVWPINPMGHSAGELRERFQWTFPIVVSPHDPETVYVSSQHLWRSTSRGQRWERISGDLTLGDPETLGPSGGPITRDQTSVEYYGTIFSVAPSPRDANTIWTGSDDGLVHVTRDGGKTWTDVTPPDLPKFSRVHFIDASPHDAERASVAAVRYRLQDVQPYVFRTTDGGRTWTKIVEGIEAGDFVRGVREDPVRAGLLFAGTEHGPYVSFDDGARWQSLRLNMPVSPIHALEVRGRDLIVATHGRSYYVLDDITPLRGLTPAVTAARAHLFAPADGIRNTSRGDGDNRYLGGSSRSRGGVTVYYHLAQPASEVTVAFLNATGEVVREFSGRAQEKPGGRGAAQPRWGSVPSTTPPPVRVNRVGTTVGLHRFDWDLRQRGATDFPGMIFWAAGTQGPLSPPGTYRVRLTVDGKELTETFTVRRAANLAQVSDGDLQAQYELASAIRDRTSEANEAVARIRDVKRQIEERVKQTKDRGVRGAADTLTARLSAVEEAIYQVRLEARQDPLNYPIRLNNKIAALLGQVDGADAPPTDQQREIFAELSAELDAELAKLRDALGSGLTEVNRLLEREKLAPILVAGSPRASRL
jgi:photosystem II stability/assembly factor-like uncharacterized protein